MSEKSIRDFIHKGESIIMEKKHVVIGVSGGIAGSGGPGLLRGTVYPVRDVKTLWKNAGKLEFWYGVCYHRKDEICI